MAAPPTLAPVQTTSIIRLPSTGTITDVANSVPFGIYADLTSDLYSVDFLSGAADQVAFTYMKMAGNVLDIELTADNVYSAYEEAVLEYSYHINLHQAKNVMSDVLGSTTGTFDHDGQFKSGSLSASLSGTFIQLKYPRFNYSYVRRVVDGVATEISLGGNRTEYSATIEAIVNQQDYDLQALLASDPEWSGTIGGKRIEVSKVFYRTPRAAWRFYGYYGGLTTVGNFHNYGQWADDSMYEVIPVWHNKLQAIQYENAIWTRLSHYSYELVNNKLRIYPVPSQVEPKTIHFRFFVDDDAWSEESDQQIGMDGINNVNTLPFTNIPFENINSMGKQWIRDYAFAISLEMLGYVRSKFATIPIPGENVTLNGSALIERGSTEQNRLRDQLKEILDQLTYEALTERDANISQNAEKVQDSIPLPIWVR